MFRFKKIIFKEKHRQTELFIVKSEVTVKIVQLIDVIVNPCTY